MENQEEWLYRCIIWLTKKNEQKKGNLQNAEQPNVERKGDKTPTFFIFLFLFLKEKTKKHYILNLNTPSLSLYIIPFCINAFCAINLS